MLCLDGKEIAAVRYRWQIADCFLVGLNEISKVNSHTETKMHELSSSNLFFFFLSSSNLNNNNKNLWIVNI